ncbi:sugar ABC transporter substrate-binding protein [Streptomyces coacervatus]|uniref:Sugar ABC transporter substrate-binding protein n=1 Tax=Streptomyces coacervatus TaxID=647381 RepID=A0ABP7HGK5_9ACTN|nr:sugar ABC transporter substrate-binding protein [Streptomyces coacervatus]MDF2265486.1 sugar ABC transporter substrate-binding protein [Streptomyces coacervatus]
MKASLSNFGIRRRCRVLVSGLLGIALLLAGCSDGDGGDSKAKTARSDTTCDGEIKGTAHITVWFHSEQSSEIGTLRSQVEEFNQAQKQVRVELVPLPGRRPYRELVNSAAASGDLPDLLDFDGPNLYSYAWSGRLRPIESCVPNSLRRDLLPSIRRQGTYAGRLWGVGTFDSGMGLFVRKSVLRKAHIRIPESAADAWSADEFTGILHKLRKQGHRTPLDLYLYSTKPGDEWPTYGFAPAVWSAGGDLIDPVHYRTADGYLNSPASVKALTTLQSWVKEGLVDPGRDDRAFVEGRSAISWLGHWVYGEYTKAFPGDVAIVPLPDFGKGTVTGMGSWQWGIPAGDADGDAVWRFLAFLLKPDEVHRMSAANGAIPSTNSAVKLSPQYGPHGAEHLYIDQLRSGVARPRPQTPAYPAITDAFSWAFRKIVLDRAPVATILDQAARRIDKDLTAHDGYPQKGS